MSQLGDRLRQAREMHGLSLAQAAVETRIRQQSLRALEEGRFDTLPNDVVAKGFLRNYAQLLDLPVDELIEQYRLERGSTQPIRVKPPSSMPQTRSYVLPGFFGVFFVTMVLVGLTYVTLSALGQIQDEGIASRATVTPTAIAPTPTALSTASPEERTPQVAASTDFDREEDDEGDAGPTPTQTPFAIPTLPPSPAGIARPTPRSQPTATPEAPIVVEVSILPGNGQGSWLRVQTDNSVAYEQIMAHGEQQVFLAQRRVSIRAGNPTYVQVSVNGLPPEVLGQIPGEPVDWTWPPQ